MKKTFRFIVKILVAAIVALAITMTVDSLDVFHYRYAFVSVYFGVAVAVALALGAFDMGAQKRSANASEEGRVKSEEFAAAVKRGYGHAAVFVGTACLFMGTLQECEDVCDDLWHYGQNARVETLNGNEVFDVI